MGIKERIEALKVDGMESGAYEVGFETGRKRAAKLAAEADELMAEMADALRKSSSRGNRFAAEHALHKYNQYKDQTND